MSISAHISNLKYSILHFVYDDLAQIFLAEIGDSISYIWLSGPILYYMKCPFVKSAYSISYIRFGFLYISYVNTWVQIVLYEMCNLLFFKYEYMCTGFLLWNVEFSISYMNIWEIFKQVIWIFLYVEYENLEAYFHTWKIKFSMNHILSSGYQLNII